MQLVIPSLLKFDEYELQLINGQIQQFVPGREVQVTSGNLILYRKSQHEQVQ